MMNNKTESILNCATNYIEDAIQILKKSNPNRVLHIVSLSDDPSSESYMKNKCKMGEKYGVETIIHRPKDKNELNFLMLKLSINKENRVIVQCPFDQNKWGTIEEIIRPLPDFMDVDGFKFNNLDLINTKSFDDMINNPNFSPTAKGVLTIMEYCLLYSNRIFDGRKVTVIGKGLTSGLPIAMMCEQLGATVTWCNSRTDSRYRDISIHDSDFIISCAGTSKEYLVTPLNKSNNPNACYINVGMSKGEDGKLKGDIDYKTISPLNNTLFCNPLLGSTGKLTTMCLILNTLL